MGHGTPEALTFWSAVEPVPLPAPPVLGSGAPVPAVAQAPTTPMMTTDPSTRAISFMV
jgi:hypothetical protein